MICWYDDGDGELSSCLDVLYFWIDLHLTLWYHPHHLHHQYHLRPFRKESDLIWVKQFLSYCLILDFQLSAKVQSDWYHFRHQIQTPLSSFVIPSTDCVLIMALHLTHYYYLYLGLKLMKMSPYFVPWLFLPLMYLQLKAGSAKVHHHLMQTRRLLVPRPLNVHLLVQIGY